MDDLTSKQRLYSIIQQIPKGCVATYGQVAELAGLPGCARMVGRTLSQLPSGSQLPWHRVIAASGKISLPENSDSFKEQKQRLADEGVRVNKNRVNLSARQRDNNTQKQVAAILRAQPDRKARMTDADDVIINDGEQHQLALEVQKLHQLYLALSTGGN